MIKRKHVATAAIALGVIGSLFGGTAAWAASQTVNWESTSRNFIGGKSGLVDVTSTTSYLKGRMNTGAEYGFQNSNFVYKMDDVQFQLQRKVNGAWGSVGNKTIDIGVYGNWGVRSAGDYRFQFNGLHDGGSWLGADYAENLYIVTGQEAVSWAY